jgi:hypothetical protein
MVLLRVGGCCVDHRERAADCGHDLPGLWIGEHGCDMRVWPDDPQLAGPGIEGLPEGAGVVDIGEPQQAYRRRGGLEGRRPHHVAVDALGRDQQDAIPCGVPKPVTWLELAVYAARSYSLISPPRMARRLIRSSVRSGAARCCGGRSDRAFGAGAVRR